MCELAVCQVFVLQNQAEYQNADRPRRWDSPPGLSLLAFWWLFHMDVTRRLKCSPLYDEAGTVPWIQLRHRGRLSSKSHFRSVPADRPDSLTRPSLQLSPVRLTTKLAKVREVPADSSTTPLSIPSRFVIVIADHSASRSCVPSETLTAKAAKTRLPLWVIPSGFHAKSRPVYSYTPQR